ncbi:hypothetical protein FRX31_014709 [Thalictrum thalictroides]|uniref:Uncharacterized protein n=1 Tax=Thalictrum thalictroides TaxID=46969 RepID=A0A7J6WH02_THATH|nr:hypothetical protein FRX31_014709 [Thalictrum thalictroides]
MENQPDIAAYDNDVAKWQEQISSAVKRSLCEGHYEAFYDFHHGIEDLSHGLACAIPRIRSQMAVFFPPPPLKVSKVNWVQFSYWSRYGNGDGVEEECSTWGEYGWQCIKQCPECRAASINHPPAE